MPRLLPLSPSDPPVANGCVEERVNRTFLSETVLSDIRYRNGSELSQDV
jgi:hypothetical protein